MEPTTAVEDREGLIGLESEYWAAMQSNNLATALRLTHFPCIVSGPHGVRTVDRQTYEAMMGKPLYTIHAFELREAAVTFPADDVAIIAYELHQDLTIDGERLALECTAASTWVRADGKWRCAAHSEAIIGDPFGRDRKPEPTVH